jgi:hypothetical protein
MIEQLPRAGASRAVVLQNAVTGEATGGCDAVIFYASIFAVALGFCLLLSGGCFALGWWIGGRRSGARDTLSPAPDAPAVHPPPTPVFKVLWTTNYGELWHRQRTCPAMRNAIHAMERDICHMCWRESDVGVAGTPPDSSG